MDKEDKADKDKAFEQPNKHAVLKNLPAELQQEIYDYAMGGEESEKHTQAETAAWIEEKTQLTVSRQTVQRFLRWWEVFVRFDAAMEMGNWFKEALRNMPGLKLAEEQLMHAGQMIFESESIKNKDDKLFLALQRLRLEQRAMAVCERESRARIRGMEKTVTDKATVIDREPARDNRALIAAMRLAEFAEIDELEASGEIVIPE